MGVEELKQALDDCIINFDAQVLVTNLLQDFQTSYSEIDKILKEHIAVEEKKGTKFEKRFLVSGEDETTENEIYAVVEGENKLQEWLRKLKNAESALYSVEVAGGAKRAADIFEPMRWCPIQLNNIKTREPLKTGAATTSGDKSTSAKTDVKTDVKKPKGFDFSANANKKQSTTESNKEKVEKKSPPTIEKVKTPQKQTTPEEKKTTTPTTKGNAKKGIANFFGPAKTEDKSKKSSGVVKPPTPKKMQDFFRKAEKTVPAPKPKEEEKAANKSMQLFANEDEKDENTDDGDEEMPTKDVVDADTSDDETQLEALRQKCVDEDELNSKASSSNTAQKRRRIIDSDDDDDDGAPQVKQEKKEDKEEDEEVEQTAAKSETFLDDDGFVITIKAKKPAVTKKPAKANTTPKKSPPNKKETDSKAPKSTPKAASKTKQGNIMSFFSKK